MKAGETSQPVARPSSSPHRAPLRSRAQRAWNLVRLRAGLLGERSLQLPGARRTLRAVRLVGHGFRGEAITLRASTLTYLTLFSLVPLLAVIYAVVDLFTGQDQLRILLSGWVNEQLGVGAGAAIAGRIDEFTTKASIKTLGAIGFGFLFLSVISLLWNIESAFNHIYNVRRPRAVLDRLLKYWSFLTLGPALLAASISLTLHISKLQSSHGAAGHSEVLHVLTALSAVAITYALLALLYKVLPNAKVPLSAALGAAFLAGTAWEVAKFFFAWGSGRMVQLNKIYGSVAVLPIVLTWVYISWLIILIGCRLCYALDETRRAEPLPLLKGAAARELLTARVMLELGRLHRRHGRPIRVRILALELDVAPQLVRECLAGLQAGGGLAVETKDGGWLPGRELSQIRLADLRRAARSTLKHPAVESNPLSGTLVEAWADADLAATAVLQQSVGALLDARAAEEERERASASPGTRRR